MKLYPGKPLSFSFLTWALTSTCPAATVAPLHGFGSPSPGLEVPFTEASLPVEEVVCPEGRVTQDREDDTNLFQVHIIYATPADGIDRQLDKDGTLEASILGWNYWLQNHTEGLRLRLDQCQGWLDISFVRFSQSNAALHASGQGDIRAAINRAIRQLGFTASHKLYLVFYEGPTLDKSCAQAPNPSIDSDRTAVVYLQGGFSQERIPGCNNSPLIGSQQPGYLQFASLHEVFHLLNVNHSRGCSPHAVGAGHVGDDPSDLMYAGPLAWQPAWIDVGRDDYFGLSQDSCYDVAHSVFMDPLPRGAIRPPLW